MPLQVWLPYSRAVFREEACLDLSSLSTAWGLRSPAAPACGRLFPHRKEEPGRKSWEGRGGSPVEGHRRGPLAGAGETLGRNILSTSGFRGSHTVPCRSPSLSVCLSSLYLIVCVHSPAHSFFSQYPCSQYSGTAHSISLKLKTRILTWLSRLPAHLFAGPCPHSLCPGHSCLLSSSVMLRTLLSPSICTGCPSAGTTPPSSVYQLPLPLRAGALPLVLIICPPPVHCHLTGDIIQRLLLLS